MVNLEATVLNVATCEIPVTGLRVGHAVDHPSTWLEMLDALPCVEENATGCVTLHVPDENGVVAIAVTRASQAAVIADTEDLRGSRQFDVSLSEDFSGFGKLALEFSVEAGVDRVEVQLQLLSHDAWVTEIPELASCAALTLAGLMYAASREVVRVYHQGLSADLADPSVVLTLAVPNATYQPVLDAALAALDVQLAIEKVVDPVYQPSCRGVLADAPPAAVPALAPVENGRVSLSTAQRLALAVNLCSLREAKKLSQLEVAYKALGFSKSHAAVSRLERGILGEVDQERLDLLAKFFETSGKCLLENRSVSGEPNQPEEGEGRSVFDTLRDFTPSADFGGRLTLARTSAGLSVQALARKLGHVNANTVANWEKETTSPRRDSFIDLAMALEVPVSWLMFGRRVGTPDRAMALRLTALQKVYGLTNGEVAALMTPTDSSDALLSTGYMVGRLSRAVHAPTPSALRALATAFQVPAEWLSPPDAALLTEDERRQALVASATAATHAEKPDQGAAAVLLGRTTKKLISDIVELVDLGVLSELDIQKIRKDLATNYMAPYIRGKRIKRPMEIAQSE